MWNCLKYLLCGLVSFAACGQPDLSHLLADDVRLFDSTPGRELAHAIADNDTIALADLLEVHPELINQREPRFGQTLLGWAVYTRRYSASRVLLAHRADPNLADTYDCTPPLIYAADNYKTSVYVRLLLAYKADPNAVAFCTHEARLSTPLTSAASMRLESVQLLVEAGADVNLHAQSSSPLEEACFFSRVDIVRYLIIEKGIDFKQPLMYSPNGVPIKFIDLMRNWTFPLDSPEYHKKMELVAFVQKQGENYWATKIPQQYYKSYPKEYLDRY